MRIVCTGVVRYNLRSNNGVHIGNKPGVKSIHTARTSYFKEEMNTWNVCFVLTETRLGYEQRCRKGCNSNRVFTIFHTFVVRATSTRELFILKCPSFLANRMTLYTCTSYKHRLIEV